MMKENYCCSSNSEAMAMDSYVKGLEEEKKKLQVFERELPLILQLVIQAIGSCQRRLEELEDQQQPVDREEILTINGPVLEEFMSLRPSNSSSSTEEEEEVERSCDEDDKPDWLRSVQLWKEPDQPTGDVLRKPIPVSVKRVGAGAAFHPFEREKNVKGPVVAAALASSTTETNGGEEEEEKEAQFSQRKARRCWSSELHRRFLNALNQLGGSHAATPKQIRDLMKVDALTNDEVKSHLQKHRLHTTRPNSSSNSAQTSPIVLVGGLWRPPPEYSAAAAAAAAQPTSGVPLKEVYNAPVATPTGSSLDSGGRCGGDDSSEDGERTNSDSSSSSQTATGSCSLNSRR